MLMLFRLTLVPSSDTIPLDMIGLWADGWFYISSAGLLVSGVLFFFLLGQYRAASAAADATESDPAEVSVASVHPVFVHEEPAPAPVASISPAKAVEAKAPEKDPSVTTSSGISPAVVYLQNIKSELAELHQEMRDLAKRVDIGLGGNSTRDEALIERLGELTRMVESMKTVPVPVAASIVEAQSQARPIEIEAAPAPRAELEPDPEFEAKIESVPIVDETMRVQLSAVVDAHVAEKEAPVEISPVQPALPAEPIVSAEPVVSAEPAVLEAPAPEAKPRRGPVWPV